eukprot:m.106206 g.106206  ORF g.106206 m.106206 type:complete len:928 (+) comp15811_c0_seq4:137-2920(+)
MPEESVRDRRSPSESNNRAEHVQHDMFLRRYPILPWTLLALAELLHVGLLAAAAVDWHASKLADTSPPFAQLLFDVLLATGARSLCTICVGPVAALVLGRGQRYIRSLSDLRSWMWTYPVHAARTAVVVTLGAGQMGLALAKLVLLGQEDEQPALLLATLISSAAWGGAGAVCAGAVFYVLRDRFGEGMPEEGSRLLAGADELKDPTKAASRRWFTMEMDTQSLQMQGAGLGRLLRMSRPDKYLIFWAVVFLVCSGVTQTAIPRFTGKVVDAVTLDNSHSEFVNNVTFLVLSFVLCTFFTYLRGVLFTLCTARMKVRLRELLFFRLMAQECAFFEQERTGDLTSRLTADTTKMGDAIGNNINIFLRAVVQIVSLLFFMMFLSWRLTLMTFALVPAVVLISQRYGAYMKVLGKRTQEVVAEGSAVAEEVCSSMHTVRAFAAEESEYMRYRKAMQIFYNLQRKEAIAYGGYSATFILLPNLVTLGVLLYGGQLVLDGSLSSGTLVSFLFYQSSLSDSFNLIGFVYSSLSEAFGAADKVFAMIDRQPAFGYLGGTYMPNRVHGEIVFRNVTFFYPSRPDYPVITDFNLRIASGEVVALVGPSGGGKSSIVALIERLYEPVSGTVLLDGQKLAHYDSKFLHRNISIVSQQPTLYGRSIRENIIFGLDPGEVSEAEIVQACTLANAHDFITSFPDGYDTQVGEKGVSLSGGQRQRIAIARALVRNPKVLLLDEATSALDAESEHLVQQAIDRVMMGRTVVVIAHRLSTIKNATRIVVIKRGRIQEQGSHAELVEKGGAYADLIQRQMQPVDDNQLVLGASPTPQQMGGMQHGQGVARPQQQHARPSAQQLQQHQQQQQQYQRARGGFGGNGGSPFGGGSGSLFQPILPGLVPFPPDDHANDYTAGLDSLPPGTLLNSSGNDEEEEQEEGGEV